MGISAPHYGSRRSMADAGQSSYAGFRPDGGESGHSGHGSGSVTAGTTVDQVCQAATDAFMRGVPYLRINTSILVACHSEAAMSSNLFSEEASVVYSDACYHDVEDPTARDSLDPHVFELVADAYAHMRRLRQDQVVVLSGVSGSGNWACWRQTQGDTARVRSTRWPT
ncbi:hypothetical protein BX661DRAFT_186760 [Kickxella alabastrina]|uniref:uncharacterized protein n=1 Tax=Kickxella alabastrina TaxID=61397 RepID=UPI002220A2FF|nr:uncharacterized protein BX661DRAFT_186760 [Kickxella alabastrina]KAI7823076.1 hypothetical protein BX661DRAFT_186760 [Kickxella alabastrina]